MRNHLPETFVGFVTFAAAVLMFVGSGCRPEPPQIKPDYVSISHLFHAYQDDQNRADGIYLNRIVRIELAAKDYTVAGKLIYWHDSTRTRQPAAIFECSRYPDVELVPIEITGICRGRRPFLDPLGPGRGWYIHVVQCTVKGR